MFEKVNPSHPDKIADRIAGAIVDLAYMKQKDPKMAVECLIGHGKCHIITEGSIEWRKRDVEPIVRRIAGEGIKEIDILSKMQDPNLAFNQSSGPRCGDNGIFYGYPPTQEEVLCSKYARIIYERHPYDGKYVLYMPVKPKDIRAGKLPRFVICQSHVTTQILRAEGWVHAEINPLGDWTGGLDVDTGAVNRKLGSDMGRSCTGGGLHGKDLSKADVSVNIHAWLKAQLTGEKVRLMCAIGDDYVDGIPYEEIVEEARDFINRVGGFEKFAEWGFVGTDVAKLGYEPHARVRKDMPAPKLDGRVKREGYYDVVEKSRGRYYDVVEKSRGR